MTFLLYRYLVSLAQYSPVQHPTLKWPSDLQDQQLLVFVASGCTCAAATLDAGYRFSLAAQLAFMKKTLFIEENKKKQNKTWHYPLKGNLRGEFPTAELI